jgi:hypothetical protein
MIDSLETGMNIFSDLEKEIIISSFASKQSKQKPISKTEATEMEA